MGNGLFERPTDLSRPNRPQPRPDLTRPTRPHPPGPLSSFAATPLVERGSRKELLLWLPLSTQHCEAMRSWRGGRGVRSARRGLDKLNAGRLRPRRPKRLPCWRCTRAMCRCHRPAARSRALVFLSNHRTCRGNPAQIRRVEHARVVGTLHERLRRALCTVMPMHPRVGQFLLCNRFVRTPTMKCDGVDSKVSERSPKRCARWCDGPHNHSDRRPGCCDVPQQATARW